MAGNVEHDLFESASSVIYAGAFVHCIKSRTRMESPGTESADPVTPDASAVETPSTEGTQRVGDCSLQFSWHLS